MRFQVNRLLPHILLSFQDLLEILKVCVHLRDVENMVVKVTPNNSGSSDNMLAYSAKDDDPSPQISVCSSSFVSLSSPPYSSCCSNSLGIDRHNISPLGSSFSCSSYSSSISGEVPSSL